MLTPNKAEALYWEQFPLCSLFCVHLPDYNSKKEGVFSFFSLIVFYCFCFNLKSPHMIWASAFSYIKVNESWYYLCIIMDLFSRKIIAWNLSSKPNAELVKTTFQKAYMNKNSPQGWMVHSDS